MMAPGAPPARAADGCVTTPTGLECTFEGTTVTVVITTLPPLRYVQTTDMAGVGRCWYWSRYPPGLDSNHPPHRDLIEVTRTLFPECPSVPGGTVISARQRAWQVFRNFTLARPVPLLRPEIGIANLPSLLGVPRPAPVAHSERLPDGRRLEVVASVRTVRVDWGDGSNTSLGAAVMFAAGASHRYPLKTCAPEERPGRAPAGRCHPTLAEYPVRVAFVWTARYRTGGSWRDLGSIERSRTVQHDVDEVIGVQVRG
jgi:hypothetical protein